jgi:DNA-binding NtrC family response regulator
MLGAGSPNHLTESHEPLRAPAGEAARDIDCAVRTGATVLISGDRERAAAIARHVHDSRPEPASFVVVECARDGLPSRALPEALDGAAPEARTVLLRDVDRLTPSQQTYLTAQLSRDRALGRPHAPVRVIATTSVALFERVSGGAFDSRLFYCLNTIHIVVAD